MGLRRELKPSDAALEAILGALVGVVNAAPAARLAARTALQVELSAWLGWAKEDLETLIGPAGAAGAAPMVKFRRQFRVPRTGHARHRDGGGPARRRSRLADDIR